MKERQRTSRYQIIMEENSNIEIAVLYWEFNKDLKNGYVVVKQNHRAQDEEHILAGKTALEWDIKGEEMLSFQPEIFRFGGIIVIKFTKIDWKKSNI